jgi:hypothetical protein
MLVLRCSAVVLLALVAQACAPPVVDVDDDRLVHHARLVDVDGTLTVSAYYAVPFPFTAFNCFELSPSWRLSVAGHPLTIVSRGGMAESGWCHGALAEGTLPAAALDLPAAVFSTDDESTFVMPLWSTLERKVAHLVDPADGVLRPDEPFRLAWPYAADQTDVTIEIAGILREEVSVADGLITLQYPPAMLGTSAAEPAEIHVTARLFHGVECRLAACLFDETWTTVIPVVLWRDPPPGT